jgi:hypothetical protein
VTRWDAFADVCGHLRAGLLGGKPPRQRRNREWELLIELSSFHYVTPSLAGCLHDEPGVPHEIREYLDAVLTLNGQRNAVLLEALSCIVATLNAIDIEPVLLKGCARLEANDYPQPNMRFLGDLDVLVPTSRTTDAYMALMANGFGQKPEYGVPPPGHYHLPALHEHKTGAGVEIHAHLTDDHFAPVLSTPGFARGHDRSGWKMVCMSVYPTRHEALATISYTSSFTTKNIRTRQSSYVNFSISHSSASGTRRRLTGPNSTIFLVERALVRCLRPTCNFAKSCWDRSRLDSALARALARSKTFADLSIHRGPPKPSTFAPVVTALAAIVTDYAAARRRDPLGILRLLRPTKWPARFKLLMDAFRPAAENK